MCCDIRASPSAQLNGSCCSGVGAINQFSIGSKLGTATSITSSSTSPSLGISPFSTSVSSSSLSPSSSRASSSAASSPAPSHPGSNGSTIGIAVGTSVGTVVLVMIASFLIYQRLRRKRREAQQTHIEDVYKAREICDPKETCGQQEHELPASLRDSRQELSG